MPADGSTRHKVTILHDEKDRLFVPFVEAGTPR